MATTISISIISISISSIIIIVFPEQYQFQSERHWILNLDPDPHVEPPRGAADIARRGGPLGRAAGDVISHAPRLRVCCFGLGVGRGRGDKGVHVMCGLRDSDIVCMAGRIAPKLPNSTTCSPKPSVVI